MSALGQFLSVADHMKRRQKTAARATRGNVLADRIAIDKDVPIPPARVRGGWPVKGYTAVLRRMVPGDSVRLPIGQAYAAAMATRVFGSGAYVSRSEGQGTRVWRTR